MSKIHLATNCVWDDKNYDIA